MSNLIIVIILLIILFPGAKTDDWRIQAKEIPWWICVLLGFTISLLGLFKYNDDRVIFAGCVVLIIAKIMSKLDAGNWAPEQTEEK